MFNVRVRQVCWIPIFKAQKLILAGDPMQLPPTIISMDKKAKKEKVKSTPSQASSTKKAGAGKSAQSKASEKPPAKEESDEESNDEEQSESSDNEDKSGLTVDPDKPLKYPPKDPRTAGTKPVLRPPRSLETTLFERLEKMYGPGIKRMLTVQYRCVASLVPSCLYILTHECYNHRMHAQIAAFPSKVMYHSKLKNHSSVEAHLLRDLPNAKAESEDDEKEILGTPVVFYDTAGCEYFERLEGDGDEGSRCNENEASVVKMWAEQLVSVPCGYSELMFSKPTRVLRNDRPAQACSRLKLRLSPRMYHASTESGFY